MTFGPCAMPGEVDHDFALTADACQQGLECIPQINVGRVLTVGRTGRIGEERDRLFGELELCL